MNKTLHRTSRIAALLLLPAWAAADNFQETIAPFRDAGESARFFDNSYGYAVFPTIGKGGSFEEFTTGNFEFGGQKFSCRPLSTD